MAQKRATTVRGASVTPGDRAAGGLGARLRGRLIPPDEAGYDDARRVWNGAIDRRPAMIARCASTADVVEVVDFARENGLLVAVRGGGHNVAGTATADGGLIVDLSAMNDVEVDPGRRTVRAGGGTTIADLDAETQRFGLAVPMGVVSKTGIGGLTLGGGIGWLRRRHGLSCDNLVSARVVTADGRTLTASASENADLFWGLRGGGGNFGVVTSFEFRAHPVGPEVMFCFVAYPGARAAEVLRFLDAYAFHAPEEVSPLGVLGRVPSEEPFPLEWHGEPFAALLAMYAGDAGAGEEVLAPLRELGDPIADLSGRMPYAEAQTVLDADYPDGGRYYWTSQNVGGLGDEEVSRLILHADTAPSANSTVDVWCMGGTMARGGAGETAFGYRGAPYLIGVEANWENPEDDAANIAWARNCVADLRRFSDGGAYLNFPGFLEEGGRMVRDAFGGNYGRLVALKNAYDPHNLFRLNHNVEPTANAPRGA